MGATWFTATASGKTAKEAFDKAVKQAQYDYGHAGYTGTIAEKNSFVVIKISLSEFLKAYKMRIDQLEADQWRSEYATKRLAEMKKSYEEYKEGTRIVDPEDYADALIDLGDKRIADKWGPAGCIEVKKDEEYFFFGWASS